MSIAAPNLWTPKLWVPSRRRRMPAWWDLIKGSMRFGATGHLTYNSNDHITVCSCFVKPRHCVTGIESQTCVVPCPTALTVWRSTVDNACWYASPSFDKLGAVPDGYILCGVGQTFANCDDCLVVEEPPDGCDCCFDSNDSAYVWWTISGTFDPNSTGEGSCADMEAHRVGFVQLPWVGNGFYGGNFAGSWGGAFASLEGISCYPNSLPGANPRLQVALDINRFVHWEAYADGKYVDCCRGTFGPNSGSCSWEDEEGFHDTSIIGGFSIAPKNCYGVDPENPPNKICQAFEPINCWGDCDEPI